MANIVTCETKDGETVQYVNEVIGSGLTRDTYFSPGKSCVVILYRKPQNEQARNRIDMIAGHHRQSISGQFRGEYWKDLFYWPTHAVEHGDKIDIVVSAYKSYFLFKCDSKNDDFLGIEGREKEGKWLVSTSNQNKSLDPREWDNTLTYFKVCLLLTRAVRRMYATGLCRSDPSYKNVFIDPGMGHAYVIDVDSLVIPGEYPPDVVGTPDFVAPEVVRTSHLSREGPNRALPSITTDRHALSVLIYMYLFFRHPLHDGKIHDISDKVRDEALSMGEKAFFIEHPTNKSNVVKISQLSSFSLS